MQSEWNKLGSVVKRKRLTHRLTTGYNFDQVQSDISPAAGETIGERLKRLRLERGFSQRELAAPGVSYAYISRIEAGTRQPSVKALRRLAAKLGVSADYLETGSDLDAEAARGSSASPTSSLRSASARARTSSRRCRHSSTKRDARATAARRCGPRRAGRARAGARRLRRRRRAARGGARRRAVRPDRPLSTSTRTSAAPMPGPADPHEAVELSGACIDGRGGRRRRRARGAVRHAARATHSPTWARSLAPKTSFGMRSIASKDTEDPYMRVRLYWSMARLAHTEGRESVALTNVRRRSRCCRRQTTRSISRGPTSSPPASRSVADDADAAERHLDQAEQLLGARRRRRTARDHADPRSRLALLRRGTAEARSSSPAKRFELIGGDDRRSTGICAASRSPTRSPLSGDVAEADDGVRAERSSCSRAQGRWRDAIDRVPRAGPACCATTAARREALDVLDRAAELGMRAAPDGAHAQALTVDARGQAARAVLARALGAALERRDAHVPRRGLHRRHSPSTDDASSRAHGSRPTARSSIRAAVAGGADEAALDPRARRRPLRLPPARPRRPDARPCVARAARACGPCASRPSRRRCSARTAAS